MLSLFGQLLFFFFLCFLFTKLFFFFFFESQMSEADEMFNLATKCLTYDPENRITAKQALKHAFLASQELRSRYLRRGIDVLAECD